MCVCILTVFCNLLLAKLTEEEIQLLAQAMIRKQYKKGTDIITQGDIGREFFVLIEVLDYFVLYCKTD